jgi:uncharacterized protein YukE
MSNTIKVDHRIVTHAGVELGGASNTISEVLGSVASVSQAPTAAPSFGEPHLGSVFDSFWTALRQQVQLSSDVLGELGKRMGGTAVTLKNGDTTGANKIKHTGGSTPAPSTTTPSTPAPGAGGDNAPPTVTSAPPPPDPTTTNPPDGSGDGTVSAPGSATPTA